MILQSSLRENNLHPKNILRQSVLFALVAFAGLNVGCGSGGSDDDDGGLRTNACDILGVKIIHGGTCSSTNTAVVAVITSFSDFVGGCTGSVISDDTVITAAHCVCDPGQCGGTLGSATKITVVADGKEVVNVVRAIAHPGFRIIPDSRDDSEGKLRNDIAILKLASAVNVPKLAISRTPAVQVGDVLSIYGYGQDENGQTGIPVFNDPPTDGYRLQSGEIRVSAIRDGTIESVYDGNGSNTCVGDSGGPALITRANGTAIAGITSVGISERGRLCQPGEVSIYTDLQDPSVASFIRSNVSDAVFK